MQAIGFLSRREHSRQELRAKLLDSLRKRAREDAALAAAAERLAQEDALALAAQPSNGIDDAFAPRAPLAPAHKPEPEPEPARASVRLAKRESATPPAREAAAGALATLRLGDGQALPAALRASLARVIDESAAMGVHESRVPTGSVDLHDPSPHPGTPVDLAAALAPPDDDLEHTDPEAAVDQLLDWLVANKYLSETRFVESRVNARSRKQGTLRIKMELSRHGLALEPEQAAALRETEFARAQELWQRKFGTVAPDARARAKQARFLAARGFAADVVRRIVGGLDEA